MSEVGGGEGGRLDRSGSAEPQRIRAAMIDLVLEAGYDGATLEALLDRAGVDRPAFERHFADKLDCCQQIFSENLANFDAQVFGAPDAHAGWRERLRACAYAAARYVRDHPREVLFDEALFLKGSELVLALRDSYMQRIVDLIDAGRQELDNPGSMSRTDAESALGSVYVTLVKELHASSNTESADEFVPRLMYLVVLPYLGPQAAEEELNMPPPPEA
jgi:AcrR family transcriptional regulator